MQVLIVLHGNNAKTNTIVNLSGIPPLYTLGATYNVSFTVSNNFNTKGGFNIFVLQEVLLLVQVRK